MLGQRTRITVLAIALVVALGAGLIFVLRDSGESFTDEMTRRHQCDPSLEEHLPQSDEPTTETDAFELVPVIDGLDMVTSITPSPRTGDLLVTERNGRVQMVDVETGSARMVVDLRGQVSLDGGEDGLLGGAFTTDGSYAYLHYTDVELMTTVQSFPVEPDGSWGDPSTVYTIQQPHRWHNGGQLLVDGDTIWIGLGDGGPMGDPRGHGQDRSTPFGALLRFDLVDGGRSLEPADGNPFLDDEDLDDEIWAYGLRNPWRTWIDEAADRLVVADVGDVCFEEINVVGLDQAGANFGWRGAEGPLVWSEPEHGEFVQPRYAYSHTNGACAVIGGASASVERYRSLEGDYLFGDFCVGEILRMDLDSDADPEPTGLGVTGLSTFGIAADGTIFVGSADTVHRLESRS